MNSQEVIGYKGGKRWGLNQQATERLQMHTCLNVVTDVTALLKTFLLGMSKVLIPPKQQPVPSVLEGTVKLLLQLVNSRQSEIHCSTAGTVFTPKMMSKTVFLSFSAPFSFFTGIGI